MAGDAKPVGWMQSALKFLVLAGLVIGLFTYLTTSTDNFKAVVKAGGDFASAGLITAFNWGTEKMGGSGATAGQAATTGPEVIYIQSSAPGRWQVGAAVRAWNKGLTTVKLEAVKECPADGTCFTVSQVSELPRDHGRLVLGRTTTFLGHKIRLNGGAVGQVPASYFPVAACHELGHALGAEHSASMKSCMHAVIGADVSARPSNADYAAVNAKYGD